MTLHKYHIVMNALRNRLLHAVSVLAVLSSVPACDLSRSDTADSKSLKNLARAAMNFRDMHDKFPPAVVLDQNGKRMHSWRVLLVPFIEANAFHDEYDSSVAWSDPVNADLVDGTRHIERPKFPDPASVRTVYQPHLDDESPVDFTTDFLMVVGKAEPLADFTEGGFGLRPGPWTAPVDASTDDLLLVQVRKSDVHWMEPRDIVLTPPIPEWGIALDEIKDDILGSVQISGDDVKINDRNATLKLIVGRQSKLKETAK